MTNSDKKQIGSAGQTVREAMQLIPEAVKEPLRNVLGKQHPYGLSASCKRRLKTLPRHTQTTVELFGRTITVIDAASFLPSHEELFVHHIYRFSSTNAEPVIIDAGANIGLASIYFYLANPDSHITAVESDPDIYPVLCENLRSFGVTNVKTIHGAVWDSSEELRFTQDRADAGRVSDDGQVGVPGIRLKDMLQDQRIDLLKMDIEGAETRVLLDCEGSLSGVDRMFVEYHSVADEAQQLSVLLGVLERSGFRYYIEHTGLASQHPLVNQQQEAGFDLQLNIFATRRDVE